jgi:hypothetical protein
MLPMGKPCVPDRQRSARSRPTRAGRHPRKKLFRKFQESDPRVAPAKALPQSPRSPPRTASAWSSRSGRSSSRSGRFGAGAPRRAMARAAVTVAKTLPQIPGSPGAWAVLGPPSRRASARSSRSGRFGGGVPRRAMARAGFTVAKVLPQIPGFHRSATGRCRRGCRRTPSTSRAGCSRVPIGTPAPAARVTGPARKRRAVGAITFAKAIPQIPTHWTDWLFQPSPPPSILYREFRELPNRQRVAALARHQRPERDVPESRSGLR